MITNFDHLSPKEIKRLTDAIPLITVLIAGADGKIDRHEKSWALKLSKIRTYSNPDDLHEYYHEVGRDFAEMLDNFIDNLPENTEKRSSIIASELKQLNAIFPKLEPQIRWILYNSLLSFAKHVAKSSGGFLGFGAISKEEKKWINLPMISKISPPENDNGLEYQLT